MGRNAQRRRKRRDQQRVPAAARDGCRELLDDVEPEPLPEEEQKRNAYVCDDCGRFIVTVDRHEGVTPMFLACRALGEPNTPMNPCKGRSVSSMYRLDMLHGRLLNMKGPEAGFRQRLELISNGWPEPTWEWYRPSRAAARRESPAVREHVDKGGLLLRPR